MEPENIEVPYLNGSGFGTVVVVNVRISNVTDLKEFSWDIRYNTVVLEFIGWEISKIFYNEVNGWMGDET